MTPWAEDFRAWAAQLTHISDEEIVKDIADTEKEIAEEESSADAYRQLALAGHDPKMNNFRATAARSGVERRKNFIAKLRQLQEYRKAQALK